MADGKHELQRSCAWKMKVKVPPCPIYIHCSGHCSKLVVMAVKESNELKPVFIGSYISEQINTGFISFDVFIAITAQAHSHGVANATLRQ